MNIKIRLLEAGDYPAFFAYLNEQLKENGKKGSPLFQPVPREIVKLPAEKEAAFVAGLSKSIGQPGWRRAWIATDDDNKNIIGHVDLRAHQEVNTSHRALLGMGVAFSWRKQGVGRALLDFSCQWAGERNLLKWIDIEVLCDNTPAFHLYESAGFETLCKIEDMYRIDGRAEGYIRMALKL